jgi:3-deoxy-D-arabino-heptulosonate 7-phosphate (DAHP) synthase
MLALVNEYSEFVLVKRGVRSHSHRNALDIQQMNFI